MAMRSSRGVPAISAYTVQGSVQPAPETLSLRANTFTSGTELNMLHTHYTVAR